MKNLALRGVDHVGTQIVSDVFKEYAGQTVYKVFDNNNQSKTLAIGYLSNVPTLPESGNPYVYSEEAANKETAQLTEDMFSVDRYKARILQGGIATDERARVLQAWDVYYNYRSGLIRSYIDFMTDIAFDGFKHDCDRRKKGSEEAKTWCDAWARAVRLKTIVHNAFSHLHITNNALVWAMKTASKKYFDGLVEIPKSSKKNGRAHFTSGEAIRDTAAFGNDEEYYVYDQKRGRTLDHEELLEYAAKKIRWSAQQLPMMMSNVAIPDCEIKGGRFPGMRRYEVTIDKETVEFVNSNRNFIKENYPPVFFQLFDQKRAGKPLQLNEHDIYHISLRRIDKEFWAAPTWLAAVPDIARRQRRMQSDEQAVSKLIKQIVLVTIGDEKFPATEAQLKAAANLFKNPSATFTVFWNHTMKVQFLGPERLAEMLSGETYNPIDASIAEDLGFPLALLGRPGSSGGVNFATLSKQILPVIHKVKTARMAMYEHFLDPLYDEIHEVMGWEPGTVRPVFNPNILEDPAQLVKRLMLYLTNRAIPYREVVEALPEDWDFDELVELFKEEKKLIDKGYFGTLSDATKADNEKKLAVMGRPSDDPNPASGFTREPSPAGEGKTQNSNRELREAAEAFIQRANGQTIPLGDMVRALVTEAEKITIG